MSAAMILGIWLIAGPLAQTPAPVDVLREWEAQQQALFEKVAPSVVFISSTYGFGSGFFVSRKGLVLTNAHVVGEDKLVSVVLQDGRRLKGTVVERATQRVDLALVQLPLDHAPVPVLDTRGLRVGSFVGAIGHGEGSIWTYTTGMVSNIYPVGAERPVFQTQIPLNPGNSGGPIFDREGRVMGVVSTGIQRANNINFGISIDVARTHLARLATECECLRITVAKGTPVFIDGALAGTGPLVVKALSGPGKHEVFAIVNGKMKKVSVSFPETREVNLEATISGQAVTP